MKTVQSLVAIAALAPMLAFAAPPRPGEYSLGGVQQICIRADGSWYGTTFPDWGGQWVYDAGTNTTSIFGNYASGDGNDNIAIKGPTARWMEWRDDLSFANYLPAVTITAIARECSATATLSGQLNPMR